MWSNHVTPPPNPRPRGGDLVASLQVITIGALIFVEPPMLSVKDFCDELGEEFGGSGCKTVTSLAKVIVFTKK